MLHLSHLEYIFQKILASAPDVSDIIITAGYPFQVESYGSLLPVYFDPIVEILTPYQTEILAIGLMKSETRLMEDLLEKGSCDFSFELGDRARFRINIFSQRGRFSIVMRNLSNEIKTLKDLRLPDTFEQIAKEKNGIVLVTGATGSGKSTTLAAILDEINRTQAVHVVTLEDPVEFVHTPKKATFNQRELGIDFVNFSSGLRAALRQAPKVILVGELRDREAVEIALAAAETGHLVLSTMHTMDAGSTISRMIGLFDSEDERQIRMRLAETLRWVISQRLLPKVGGGREAALEIMGSSIVVRDLILNGESLERNFYSIIESLSPLGYQTFDQHILKLFENKKITEETARIFCTQKSVVNRGIDRVKAVTGEYSKEKIRKLTLERVEEEEVIEENLNNDETPKENESKGTTK